MPHPRHAPYVIGDVIGYRTVISGPESRPAGMAEPKLCTQYLCRCRCGSESWVMRVTLAAGKAMSCRSCSNKRRAEAAGRTINLIHGDYTDATRAS